MLATQASRVTAEIERLLGFKSDQFTRVVMLPQGKFRKLLEADSRGREDILETLFQTEVYSRIEEALKERARQAKQALEAAELEHVHLLDRRRGRIGRRPRAAASGAPRRVRAHRRANWRRCAPPAQPPTPS